MTATSDADLRSLRARVAVHTSWAKTEDRAARTANARKAFADRWEKQVDPDGVLDPEERAKRAANAKQAFYLGMAYKSAASRRKAAKARQAAAELDAEADAADAALSEMDGSDAA